MLSNDINVISAITHYRTLDSRLLKHISGTSLLCNQFLIDPFESLQDSLVMYNHAMLVASVDIASNATAAESTGPNDLLYIWRPSVRRLRTKCSTAQPTTVTHGWG